MQLKHSQCTHDHTTTLQWFVALATEMTPMDHKVLHLPHEFLSMQYARWAAQLPRTAALLQHAYFLSFRAPTNLWDVSISGSETHQPHPALSDLHPALRRVLSPA